MADSASFISQLNISLPTASATASKAAQRWQHIKRAIKATLPNMSSQMSATPACLNHLNGLTANFQTQLNTLKNNAAAMSGSIQTRINTMSTSLNADVGVISASRQAQVNAMRTSIETNSATASATVETCLLWDGAAKYVQTATPSANVGDIWFQI